MRCKIIFLCVLFALNVSAQNATKGKVNILPFIGYQQTGVKWSIAGDVNGENPNVLSELIWKDLRGLNNGINITYNIVDAFSVKLNASYASFTKGHVNDTDYAMDNRQDISYQENFNAGKGFDINLRPAISYSIYNKSNFSISPFIGYTFKAQKLCLYDFSFVPNRDALNSNYRNNWKGLGLGTDINYTFGLFDVSMEIGASLLKYTAKAKWNLIPQFAQPISFTHRANAFATQSELKFSYRLSHAFKVSVLTNFVYSKGLEGTDRAYYENGDVQETLFNGIKSTSYSVNLGLNYNF